MREEEKLAVAKAKAEMAAAIEMAIKETRQEMFIEFDEISTMNEGKLKEVEMKNQQLQELYSLGGGVCPSILSKR